MKSIRPILIPRQLILLLILSTGLLNHVMLIPSILNAAGRDGWISIILTYPILFIFTLLIYYIVKNSPQEGFYHLLNQKWNKWFVFLFSLPMCLFLLSSAYITFVDLIIWLSAYFLADVPSLLVVGSIFLICFLISWSGIKHMAIASGILLPLVMLFGFFIAFTNTNMKDPSLLFPIFSNGYEPVFKGMIYVLSGLLELYLIVLIQPYSEGKIKFHHLIVLGLIIMGLMLGPLSASIMEFGHIESANMRYPAYEQWRILSIGEFITHLDFFALYQWLCGALIRISLFMFLLAVFFTKKKDRYQISLKVMVPIFLILLVLIFIDVDTYFFYKFLYVYFFPATVVLFTVQIISSAVVLRFIK
ncbi:endospore germination permease [Rossellomorea yichunensis]|jgi:spore germination protein KB|uniref:endospore germination permease n=1 Tax=Rossellomorea yichunensis TaxID=3077331 RepID=UPI0028DDC260|nr:endospore germination permease [Rossellomorea sp. YC4-1]MDT9024078.1 endospore germination permease [Rossellomorea sp. YC4-1]